MMEEALTALLLADPGVAARVDRRVHWDVMPRGTGGYPRVILQLVSAPDDYVMDGRSKLSSWEVQLDVWGRSKSETTIAARACRDLLSGYRGDVAAVAFRAIFINRASNSTGETSGTEDQLHRARIDLNISWKPKE